MAKLTLTPVSDTSSPVTMNANFDAIEAFAETVLSRDGTTPNQMEAVLDMNSNDIINGGIGRFERLFLNGTEISTTVGTGGGPGGSVTGLADYANNTDMAADHANLTNNDIVYSGGKTSIGDGGGGIYRYTTGDISTQVTSDPQAGLYVARSDDATGASGGFILMQDGWNVNPINFGVTVDTGDVVTEFKDMISALSTRYGFADIVLDEGTYTVNADGTNALLITQDHIMIRGSGRQGTIIKHGTGNGHTVSIDTVTGGGLFNLQIDGGRGTAASGHALRLDALTDHFLKDLRIENAHTYGIGLQGGTNTGLRWDSIEIDTTGHDGIDVKNPEDNSTVNFMTNISVKNHGQDATVKAGIDLRGPWHLNNIRVTDFGTGNVGVRFREGALLDVNGYGAHDSVMTNFFIDGTSSPSSSIGIAGNVNRLVVGDGVVRNVANGIISGVNEDQKYSDVFIDTCTVGVFAQIDNCVFEGIKTHNCGTGARIDSNNTSHNRCDYQGSTEAIRVVASTENDNEFNYCMFDGTVTDNGTGTLFQYCIPATLNTTTGSKMARVRDTLGAFLGTTSFTGFGFTPTWIMAFAAHQNAVNSSMSIGYGTGTGAQGMTAIHFFSDGTNFGSGRNELNIVYAAGSNGNFTAIDIVSFDSDGITVEVTDNSGGDMDCFFICGNDEQVLGVS